MSLPAPRRDGGAVRVLSNDVLLVLPPDSSGARAPSKETPEVAFFSASVQPHVHLAVVRMQSAEQLLSRPPQEDVTQELPSPAQFDWHATKAPIASVGDWVVVVDGVVGGVLPMHGLMEAIRLLIHAATSSAASPSRWLPLFRLAAMLVTFVARASRAGPATARSGPAARPLDTREAQAHPQAAAVLKHARLQSDV
ncbi:hypothetical protein ONE63_005199 [Megalurothrips usitatus]|uniref:Uncharacterized protein n=1 Tax=Megalurothrips usitatus TaxID=439358 RepID=A0AAV7XUN0_9NEOP|nr:hypothetical protein ONE63_005199 [Megalurothrips usitatus]